MSQKENICAIDFACLIRTNIHRIDGCLVDWRPFLLSPEIEKVFEGKLVLKSGQSVDVGQNYSIDWTIDFKNRVSSNVLWLYSLEYVGVLLSGYEITKYERYINAAIGIVECFLNFIDESENNRQLVWGLRGFLSRDHAVSTRANVFVQLLHTLQRLEFRRESTSKIVLHLMECALFLIDDKNHTKSNHGVMTDMALLQLGCAVGIDTVCGGNFINHAAMRLELAINNAFCKDGLCNENLIGYHRFNIGLYESACKFFHKYNIENGFTQAAGAILLRAKESLGICVWQNGSIPPIGDSPIYTSAATSINQSKLFAESNFAVIKNENLYVSFICGKASNNHKTIDDTSITIRYMDVDIVIDGGSYSYDQKDPHRKSLQSTYGHSGIFLSQVEGMTPAQYLKLNSDANITNWVEDDESITVTGVVLLKRYGAMLRRTVKVIWPNKISISDHIKASDEVCNLLVRQAWLLGKSIDIADVIEKPIQQEILCTNGSINALFSFSKTNDTRVEYHIGEASDPSRGWCSEKFGEIIPTMELSRIQSGSDIKFETCITLSKVDCRVGSDKYNVSAWNLPTHSYSDVEAALASKFTSDGIHQIGLGDGQTLDLCIQGLAGLGTRDAPQVLLVGFSGAVAARDGKKAPFFSGLSIAKSLGLPIIAVSDPTLALDNQLPLAWYAGSEAVPDLPVRIARVLDHIARQHQVRLLLFGGSGGGFAALLQATLLEVETTVLVWNPQTAIAEYAPQFVAQFIKAAFSGVDETVASVRAEANSKQSERLREVLDLTTITHDVRDLKLPPHVNLLYLQNQSDWHVARHAVPYLTKKPWRRVGKAAFIEEVNNQLGVFFGHWGQGHVAPPKVILETLLRKLAGGESIVEVMQALSDGLGGLNEAPPHVHWVAAEPDFQLMAQAWVEDAQVQATCSVGEESNGPGGVTYAFYLLVDGVRQAMRWYETKSNVFFDLPDVTGKLEVVAFARDSLGGQVSVRIPVDIAGCGGERVSDVLGGLANAGEIK